MKRTPLQLAMDLPRRRVALEETTINIAQGSRAVLHTYAGPSEIVDLRLPVETAKIVLENPMAARAALQARATDALAAIDRMLFVDDGYTPWYTDRPWCSGFWEIRQKSARGTTTHLRVWYEKESNKWTLVGARVPTLDHSELAMSHFWRGLRAPSPEGYTYKVPGQRVRLLA